jgi:hypothetical protein
MEGNKIDLITGIILVSFFPPSLFSLPSFSPLFLLWAKVGGQQLSACLFLLKHICKKGGTPSQIIITLLFPFASSLQFNSPNYIVMENILIRGGTVVNDDCMFKADVLISEGKIA